MTTTESRTIRTLIRYAIVMVFLTLLLGLAYQESAKKLTFTLIPGGSHLEAVLHLALVHGHFMTVGVLLPLALAGALVLGRKIGGTEVPGWAHKTLLRGYLPFAVGTLLLQLYKGYHILLMARAGERDFAVIDAAFMGGSHALRYGIYGVVHTLMGVTLGVFLVALWRSLKGAPARS